MKLNLNNKKILYGLLSMAGGVLLLLHTLGIIETGINLVLILFSVAMITYGFITSGIQSLISNTFKKHKNLKVTKKENKPRKKKAPRK